MPSRAWVVWATGGGVAVAVGVVTLWAGLDTADKAASVVGALCGVIGLGLSARALTQARRSQAEDPALERRTTNSVAGDATVTGTVVQAESIGGSVVSGDHNVLAERGGIAVGQVHVEHHHHAAETVRVPRQLPLSGKDFVGREAHLHDLDAKLLAPGASWPLLLTGSPGVGKTTLALHWAHLRTDRFPDGQLYADLQGFTPGQPMTAAKQVLEGFLLALGVPSENMPTDLSGLSAEYRTQLASRKMLVVLDNAGSSAQVAPLLSPSPECRTLLTSRRHLPALEVDHLKVDVFSVAESTALLRTILGAQRVDQDRATATVVANKCARLPLALRVAAERIRHRPHHNLRSLAAELDETRLPEVPGDQQLAVSSAFQLSYQSLDSDSAMVFRLLGAHLCAEISEPAVVALTGMTPDVVRAALAVLLNAHLLEEVDRARYRFHDLLREFARQRADEIDTVAVRNAAIGRLVAWFAAEADHADHQVAARRARLHPDLRAHGTGFANHEYAMNWCARELTNIEVCLKHAHELGMNDLVWQVPAAMQGFFNLSKRVAAQYSTHLLGLAAAQQAGSMEGVALMHLGISSAHRFWKDDGQAIDHGLEALEGFRNLGNRRFEGIVLSNVAMSYVYTGRFDKAYELFKDSLAAAREVGDRHAEAWALTNLGAAQRRNGLLDDSLSALRRAAEIRTAIDDLDGEAWTRAELGRTCSDLGLSDAAEAAFERSIALHLAHGNTYGRARALDQLGAHLQRTGQYDRAREVWEEALPLFTALRGSDAARLRLNLASLSDRR